MKSSFLNRQKLLLSFLVIILCSVSAISQSSDAEIKRSVIAGGGNAMTTGNLKLTGTVGQSAAGTVAIGPSGTRTAVAGFWQPESHVDAGNAPTNLVLSNFRVQEARPIGWTIGVFSTVDPDFGDQFTYSLVPGEGGADNAAFRIETNALKTKTEINWHVRQSYNIRVRTTDQTGLFLEKQFIIIVDQVGEIRFGFVTMNVNESTGVAAIVIQRSGVTGGQATVDFTTVAGSGTASQDDYTAVTTTVFFGDGEGLKTINVPLVNDQLDEESETFLVRLSNVTGSGKLGHINQGEVVIKDDDPTGAVINFGQANYTVTETGPGFIDITVTRGGDTSVPLTVDYATPYDSDSPMEVSCVTRNGTAMPRCDFTAALGTLRFAAGETSKTFTVLISQDSYLEGPETLPITLSNVTGGGVLGAQATATLTITDDLTEPTTNAIDDPANFVRQHYHDFLNREPDAAGLDFWTRQITDCGTDQNCIIAKRVNVSGAFFLSIEFQQTGYFVERLYKVAYGDAIGQSSRGETHDLLVPMIKPDEFLRDSQEIRRGVVVGQSGWEAAIENNRKNFATMFTQRARFVAEHPTIMTAGQFVDKLNGNAGNPLSEQERNQLVDALISGARTRAQVLRAIAEHPSLYQAEFNRAFVLMQYYGYLRRNPNRTPDNDWAGYEFWLTKLNEFGGNFVNAEMVRAFLDSAEYRQRFRQ
jgi:hypothetical protein